MPPSSGELWGHHLMPAQICVDCLMPTGVIIPISCARDATLERIKTDLFGEAKKYPLHYHLSEPTSYIFVSITQDAEREEFYDETRRLCDLRLFQPILKVVEPKGNREEKMLNYEIGLAVGMPVSEFNEIKELETMTFRRNILGVCKQSVNDRESEGRFGQALYSFPPDVESTHILPPHIEEKLLKDADRIIVCIWVMSADKSREKYTVQVHHTCTPEQVISEAIRRRTRTMGLTVDEQQKCIQEYTDTYVLKVCGCDQFFLAKYPISQYKYIRQCIAQEKIPQLMLMTKISVYDSLPKNVFKMPAYAEKGKYALADINNQQTKSLWELNTQLRIQINCATHVSVREVGKIYVKTGVYHGTEPLCPNKDTARVDSFNPRWSEWLEYDLFISDIPRSARLCFSICTVKVGRRRHEQHCALAWGNLQLFDFNDRLLSDKISLHLWPMPQMMDDLLNPIGIPGSNPDHDCPCLEIEFDRFTHPVSYPPDYQIDELANFVSNHDNANSFYHRGTTAPMYPENEDDVDHIPQELEILNRVISMDPLSEISEQEKDLLWKYRNYCSKKPHSLPKVLAAVKWNSREDVAQLYRLLEEWPVVGLETGLELLDCSYPDLRVRKFAVTSLEQVLTDDQLSQFLLQLVQALKFEPYLDNRTTRFLIRRALLNQKIGHFFFWHLKSEIHQTSIRIRFGLVLEAYCRGCGAYIKSLIKQVEAQEKLTNLTDTFKNKDNLDEQMRLLFEHMKQTDYQEALQSFTSPLNNSHILGDIHINKCKVHQSKKRPLSLVWNNPDPMADLWYKDYRLMFKNGDDLRQDMLTLQVLRIMDNIWESEGLDMRLIPYGCLSTGKDVGMIELVRNSQTVMAIQKRAIGGAMQVDSSQLHKWIKENNKGDKYQPAIESFTRSCAGYCVATFVLGIGDRHSENIMVTKDGRVFHIDFGHFLNHKKKKFGINRERVPFVLTDDFVRVIMKGADNPAKSEEFMKFQQLCIQAYKCLRKHANLFIVLFTMMLSCGIPELQSLDDIGYLRKTLAVESTEEEAVLYFQQQLQDAHKGAWSTKLNFFFHGLGQTLLK